MHLCLRTACSVTGGVLLAAGVFALPVAAGGRTSSEPRRAIAVSPVKDCTRLNGRMGYYGNPWCTPAEQARWDRRDSRRTFKR